VPLLPGDVLRFRVGVDRPDLRVFIQALACGMHMQLAESLRECLVRWQVDRLVAKEDDPMGQQRCAHLCTCSSVTDWVISIPPMMAPICGVSGSTLIN